MTWRRRTRLAMTAIGATSAVACVLGDGALRRVGEVRRAAYDLETGEVRLPNSFPRGCETVWDGSFSTGYYASFDNDRLILDWGDSNGVARIDEFEFGYATTWPAPMGIDVDIVFFVEENGFDSVQRVPVQAFRLSGLPGHTSQSKGPENTGWIISVALAEQAPFRLLGSDLESGPDEGYGPPGCDGYQFADFGYSFHFRNVPDNYFAGPLMTWDDPNAGLCAALGIEVQADLFRIDPTDPPKPNSVLIAGVSIPYAWTYWFAEWPPIQFHMRLTTCEDAPPCPDLQAPCWNADIAPGAGIRAGGGDCVVDLGDLSVLLANFGTTSGAAFADGDIDPPLNLDTLAVGDGDVDLADLSRLLAAFGTDCR